MGLESGFDDLQKVADAAPDAVIEARRRRDVFRSALGERDGIAEMLPSGSLARGTHKDPIHDVDLIAIFDAAAHSDWGQPGASAETALEHTRSIISERLGSNGSDGEEVRLTRIQNHSVKCFLDDPEDENAFSVDVTPALRHPEGGLLIPEGRSAKWIRTDPEHLIKLVADRHFAWNQFAKLVRVLKRWNSDHGDHMKSLVVEILALDLLPIADRPTALARFFAAAQVAVWQPVCDPAGLCGEIQSDLDRAKTSETLARAADTAARAIEAEARAEKRRAMCLWREVFGDAFPEPFGGCAEGALAPSLVVAAPKRKIVDAPQG